MTAGFVQHFVEEEMVYGNMVQVLFKKDVLEILRNETIMVCSSGFIYGLPKPNAEIYRELFVLL